MGHALDLRSTTTFPAIFNWRFVTPEMMSATRRFGNASSDLISHTASLIRHRRSLRRRRVLDELDVGFPSRTVIDESPVNVETGAEEHTTEVEIERVDEMDHDVV